MKTTLFTLLVVIAFVSFGQNVQAANGAPTFVKPGQEYFFNAPTIISSRLGQAGTIEVIRNGGGSWFLCAYNDSVTSRLENVYNVRTLWINFSQLISLEASNDRDRIQYVK